MTTKRDYYAVLGVDRNVTPDALTKAYRKLAMQYHPDRNQEAGAEERFKEVAEAYEVLSDPDKRRAYDQFGHAGVNGAGAGYEGFGGFSGGFSDIFDQFFNAAGGGRSRTGPRRGADLRYQLEITFEEAVFGTEKEIAIQRTEQCAECSGTGSEPGHELETCPACRGQGEVRRVQQSIFGQFVNVSTCDRCRGAGKVVTHPCPACKGSGREKKLRRIAVKIPGGVDDEAQIRLSGEGDAGSLGGPAGNLYVQLRVRPHRFFQRDGLDIVLERSINVAQAALGDEIQVPTLSGEMTVKIPAGTQTGKVVQLKEQGVPSLRTGRRGDQLVVLKVEVPRELTTEQEALFRQLAESLGSEVKEQPHEEKGFFDKLKDALTG